MVWHRIYRRKKDRVRWNLYIDPEIVNKVDKYKNDQKYYKSDFVENALRFYIEKLEAENGKNS